MKPIVECIPNFSEGRRPEVIDQIVTAIESVAGIRVLDRSSDADHNRTVITFVGPPAVIGEAAFATIARAAELIDMDQQHGEHPRMGATDVVPFVPIAGVTMAGCVEIARKLGARVGTELGIPVYLYEAAATRPDRVNLGDIRPQSHQYEQKKADVGREAKWAPDFGPAKVGRPFRLPAHVGLFLLVLVRLGPNIAQVDPVGTGGGGFIEVNGDAQFRADARPQLAGNLHTVGHRHAGNRHERYHVGRPHAGMLAVLLVHVNQLGGAGDGGESSLADDRRRADKGDDRPVVVRIRRAVQHPDARHAFDSGDDPVNHLGPPPFAEIGHAFHYLSH